MTTYFEDLSLRMTMGSATICIEGSFGKNDTGSIAALIFFAQEFFWGLAGIDIATLGALNEGTMETVIYLAGAK